MAFGVLRQIWRLMYSAVGTLLRHPIAGTSIVPVMPDGRIVLIRRRDTDKWALPGGVIDWGEEIRTTVQRELEEETGLDLYSPGWGVTSNSESPIKNFTCHVDMASVISIHVSIV